MKKVVLVWGGWSCTAGYIHWAYVAAHVGGQPVNTEIPGCEKIGEKLFDAPSRKDVTNPKNCDFGKTPGPFPRPVCREWIKEHKYELITEVKMRTD